MAITPQSMAILSAIVNSAKSNGNFYYHSFHNSFPKNNPHRVITLLIIIHYTNVAPIILGADDKFKLDGNEKA